MRTRVLASRRPTFLLAAALAASAACGGGGRPAYVPFLAEPPPPSGTPSPAPTPPPSTPPPTFPRSPVWTETAHSLERVATFGSFPSDLVRLRATLFTTDADQMEGLGARIVPVDVSGVFPVASTEFPTTTVVPGNLLDSDGLPGDAAAPIGFGFYVNDLAVVADDLGFALVNAGGSDSTPGLSNLVVFDPSAGTIRQVVDLALDVATNGRLDSSGAAVAGATFRQSQAEGLCWVPTDAGRGRLFVAMANILFEAPSFGTVKLPGTVQAFEVDAGASVPVAPTPSATLVTNDYNPSAVSRVQAELGVERILVTVAGTTAFDASFQLFPATPASIEAYDARTLDYLGRFDLGLVGLSSNRPAIGRDGAGHAVAYFASSVLGEVYLVRIDGLHGVFVDPSKVAVLRGVHNGIAIDPALAGGPGGNVAGLALSSDGRTLVASGFGDYFAFPTPRPGRLLALALPSDVVSDPDFARTFVPGTSNVLTTSGRTLGPLLVGAFAEGGPEVFVAVAGTLTPSFLGAGPASIGTLNTFGRIR